MILSRGARLCEAIIRTARTRRGGTRECGRPYLARRLACSTRTVSRYVAELRDAGRLEVAAPRRVRVAGGGWRTVGVNRYRLTRTPHPAPHTCRSHRGDTPVTPVPNGTQDRGATAPPGQLIDAAAATAAMLQQLGLTRASP